MREISYNKKECSIRNVERNHFGYAPKSSPDELGGFFYLNSIINTKINKRIIMAITILEETKNSIKSF